MMKNQFKRNADERDLIKNAFVHLNGLAVYVKIVDVQTSWFGKTKYLVAPIMGEGEIWVRKIYLNAKAALENQDWPKRND